ncbi:MAG: regulatory iron-sulfur-containing complex subunit RicT, partial [Bdellovibrionota bacterium]
MMNHPAAFDSPLFDEIKPFNPPDTRRIVGVRLRNGTRLVDCDTGGAEYKKDSWVVVDSGRGQRLAEVMRPSRAYLHRGERMPRVVRAATKEDMDRAAKMVQREQDAFLIGVKVIQEKNLPFKLIAMEWAEDGSKAIAYFCSEDRVDFRDFVWDLSAKLHTRIEMRQVGIRDQSGMVGGVGDCGRELCCSSWLKGFSPISIKMAKNQGLALDNEKLTGQCGRLKCCLAYEDETYAVELRSLPKRGFKFDIENRRHVVISINALRRRVLVQEIETGAQFLLDSPIFNALLKKPEVATNSKLGFLDPEAERLAIEMAPT